jgi:hypothetical protein
MKTFTLLFFIIVSSNIIGATIVQPINDSTPIPKSIVDRLTWDGLPDNVFHYTDNTYSYWFNEDKILIAKYDISDNYISSNIINDYKLKINTLNTYINFYIVLIIILVIIGGVLAGLLSAHKKSQK